MLQHSYCRQTVIKLFLCHWLVSLLLLLAYYSIKLPDHCFWAHKLTLHYTSFGKSHLTAWSVFDAWQLWFTERSLRNYLFTLFHRVSAVLHRDTDVRSSIRPSRHTWFHSSVHNTWELRGLLFAPGERRDAQEAGDANLDGPLSPGLTPFPGLPGWAAAAGWKKSAGRWKTGEDPPPPPLQLPPSPPEKKRLYFISALSVLIFIFLIILVHLLFPFSCTISCQGGNASGNVWHLDNH